MRFNMLQRSFMPYLAKPNVEGAVEDLIGGGPAKSADAKKPASTPGTKAPSSNKGAAPSSNKQAPGKGSGKAAAGKGTKPTTKAKAPAKKKAATGERGARGSGKFYFPPEQKEALAKELKQKVRKPVSTKEWADEHKQPTWKVRLAAKKLVEDGHFKPFKQEGAVLIMAPK